MSHHNSHHSFRLPRSNMQEPRRVRRSHNRARGYQAASDHEQPFDQNTVYGQPSGLRSNPWDGDSMAVPYTDPTVLNTYAFSEPAARDTSGIDRTFDNNHHTTHSTIGELIQEGSPVPYQPAPHDQAEASMAPATHPADEAEEISLETTYDPTGVTPWPEDQAGHVWVSPTRQEWEIDGDIAPDQMRRRWSIRARQGSDVAFYGDTAAPILMDPLDAAGEHDSSGTSGNTTPVDWDHIVNEFMGSENAPWCPENPHKETRFQYPYQQ